MRTIVSYQIKKRCWKDTCKFLSPLRSQVHRIAQQKEVLEKEREAAEKIAARAYTQQYLADLVPAVFKSLYSHGYFNDPVEKGRPPSPHCFPAPLCILSYTRSHTCGVYFPVINPLICLAKNTSTFILFRHICESVFQISRQISSHGWWLRSTTRWRGDTQQDSSWTVRGI